MNPVPFILLAISLPLLLGGCGEIFKVPLNKVSKADQDFLKAKPSPAKPVPTESPSEKPSDTLKSLSEADVERLLEVAIDIESLEERNGLMYQVNESEPYSGWGKLQSLIQI